MACSESNAADVIDLATRKSLRRMPLGDDPEAFDFSADGKTLYVSQRRRRRALSIVDAASGKMLKTVPGRQGARGREDVSPTARGST